MGLSIDLLELSPDLFCDFALSFPVVTAWLCLGGIIYLLSLSLRSSPPRLHVGRSIFKDVFYGLTKLNSLHA